MADLSDDTGGVILDGPFDPDAQATVTDYIDYTEFLPADIIRSLTLIRGLDERYLEAAQDVHSLTRTYGQLPELAPDARPNPQTLRKDVSFQLDRAINARESAYAEACRLYDVVDRHYNRLGCIRQKLEALPKPTSREPTPPSTVANNKRARSTKKGEDGSAQPTTTRITLRLDSQDNAGTPSTSQKSRSRRSMIAAEHLADFNPDSPIASTEHSDVEADSKKETSPPDPEIAKVEKTKKEKQNSRSRPPGTGTNAHSAVAGISTSNALALLQPPPEGARPGSPDMPWLRLTEWEMTKLRKKMKKNAVWQPSEVMIHRELALRGRGWEAYRAAKAESEANGIPFVDCDDIMNTYVPGKLTRLSEATKDQLSAAETKLSNRGMKLNEAKKLKRENLAREQAAAAAAAEEARRKSNGSIIPPTPPTELKTPVAATPVAEKPTRSSKKRKVEEEVPAPDAAAAAASASPGQPDGEARTALRSAAKRRKTSKATPSSTPMEASESASSGSVNVAATTATPATVSMPAAAPEPPANPINTSPVPAPAEPRAPSAESKPAQAESKPVPAEPKLVPAEPKLAPTESKPAPAESKPAPAESKPAPAEPKPAPAEPKPARVEPKSGRADSKPAPAAPAAPVAPVAPAAPAPPAPAPEPAEKEATNTEAPATQPVAQPPLREPREPRDPRRRSTAVSTEPALAITAQIAGRDLRRKSATPARKTPVPEAGRSSSVSAPTRRRKRPAPGPISSGQNGGAAVSYGRRKAKPAKKRVGQKDDPLSRDDVRIDEDGVVEEIDPNEPRYCLCGDISFGTMICCENQDCDREWFHLDCVGLTEVPSRTAKWYCPACRVKFNKGVDGIVKIGPRR